MPLVDIRHPWMAGSMGGMHHVLTHGLNVTSVFVITTAFAQVGS